MARLSTRVNADENGVITLRRAVKPGLRTVVFDEGISVIESTDPQKYPRISFPLSIAEKDQECGGARWNVQIFTTPEYADGNERMFANLLMVGGIVETYEKWYANNGGNVEQPIPTDSTLLKKVVENLNMTLPGNAFDAVLEVSHREYEAVVRDDDGKVVLDENGKTVTETRTVPNVTMVKLGPVGSIQADASPATKAKVSPAKTPVMAFD
jgi:hypothetical protein